MKEFLSKRYFFFFGFNNNVKWRNVLKHLKVEMRGRRPKRGANVKRRRQMKREKNILINTKMLETIMQLMLFSMMIAIVKIFNNKNLIKCLFHWKTFRSSRRRFSICLLHYLSYHFENWPLYTLLVCIQITHQESQSHGQCVRQTEQQQTFYQNMMFSCAFFTVHGITSRL